MALLFFFGFVAFFVVGLRLAPPPRVGRAFSALSSACNRLAYAASSSSSSRWILLAFFGGGESATSLNSSESTSSALRFVGEVGSEGVADGFASIEADCSLGACATAPLVVGGGSTAPAAGAAWNLSKRSMIKSVIACCKR